MNKLLIIIICLIAGIGAGLGTGFVGMSAAVVITPMITTYLNVGSYEAIGIALASDILASLVSAILYARHKHVNLKKSWLLLVCCIFMTIVGSVVSSRINEGTLGYVSLAMTTILGVKFLVKPYGSKTTNINNLDKTSAYIRSALAAIFVGFGCGFMGAGGGIMLLFVLTYVLGYDLKTAVGTSVLMMSIIALTGSSSHLAINLFENFNILLFCVIFTLIFAIIGSFIANKVKEKTLYRISGVIILVIDISIFLVKFLPSLSKYFAV